jgi:hypothetical protein
MFRNKKNPDAEVRSGGLLQTIKILPEPSKSCHSEKRSAEESAFLPIGEGKADFSLRFEMTRKTAYLPDFAAA